MLKRAGYLILLLLLALVIAASTAGADTVDVVVDSGPITLAEADDGAHTAKVTIVNATDASIPVGADTRKADGGCTITPDPKSIDAASRTTVTLKLSSGCEVASGTDIVLTFVGASPDEKTIKADPPRDTTPDWSIIAWALGVAFVLVLVVNIWVIIRTDEINRDNKKKQGEPYPPAIVGPATPLSGLGTSWSFKDSWVSNVSLGASALIALFAASDILTSVLGEKPTAALGLIAVAAGIAAICVTAGPLVLKAVGGEVAAPTAAGTVIASSLVLFGSFTQIGAITIQAAALVDREWLVVVLATIGILTAIIVGTYGGAALGGFMKTGASRKPPPLTPQVEAAQLIAEAIARPSRFGVLGKVPDIEVPEPQVWTPPTSGTTVL